jgi:hypothetical protein
MRRLALVLAACLPAALAAGPAGAQERCADLVDRLGASGNSSTGLPSAAGGASSDRLARSGGVIAPPAAEGRTPTIQPPSPGPNAMPTAPAIEPQTGSGATAPPETAAARVEAQVDSLLASARAAAGRGDEAECRRHLGQAMALMQDRPR